MAFYFADAMEMSDYYVELVGKHQPRLTRLLALQNIWSPPITMTPGDDRVVFTSNEPMVATRMILALASSGKLVYKAILAPEVLEGLEEGEADHLKKSVSSWERALIGHYTNLDHYMFSHRRATYIRQLIWFMAVHGWSAGINYVQDAQDKDWPVFSDVWNPMSTFNDLESDGIFHVTKMTVREIETVFGPDRAFGPIEGYNFDTTGMKPRDKVDVVEWWNKSEHAILALGHTGGIGLGGQGVFIKPTTEHGMDHNPAWCNPTDACPFDIVTSNRAGEGVNVDNVLTSRWLAWQGQSPIAAYETQYKVLTQMANMIQDKIAKWAKDMVIVQSADGSFKTVTTDDLNHMDPGDTVQIIQPGKFPADDRAWIAFIKDEMEKGSFPRAAYGIANQEAQSALQILKQASGPIVDPIITELTRIYQYSAESIKTQLLQKKSQYRKAFPIRTVDILGRPTMEFINLSELPNSVYLMVDLRGAGPQEDRFQKLLAVTNAANAKHPLLTDEILLSDYLDRDAPELDIAKMLNQVLTSDQTAIAGVAPIWTALNLADKIREFRHTKRATMVADMLEAIATKSAQDLQNALSPQPPPAAPGTTGQPGGMMMGAASAQPPPGPPGLGGEAQTPGMAPPGAPPPGSIAPPTGPPAAGGMLQAAGANLAPPPAQPPPM